MDSLNIKGPRQNSDSGDIIGQNAESVKPKFSLHVWDTEHAADDPGDQSEHGIPMVSWLGVA